MPRIRAVCFDLDGLMFNTEEVFNRSGAELLRRRAREMTPELLSQMMGRRSHEAFQIMMDSLQLTESMAELQVESAELFAELLEEMLAPMPGLFELLERIEHRELPKGVATSSSRGYLTDLLGRFDLESRFDMLLGAEDVTHGKPHPEIYLTAAERLGVDPSEMLVLEDSQQGTAAAAAAGAYIVSVPHEHSRAQDFSPARRIANRLDDPAILELVS